MMRSVRSYDARRTRRSKNPRRVLKTRRVMRDATARGRITVRTAEPMVPTTVKAPATVSSTRAKTSIDPLWASSLPRGLGSDEPSDVVRRVEELDAATEAQLADVSVSAGHHAELRSASRAAMRAARRPIRVEPPAAGPARWAGLTHALDDAPDDPRAGRDGQHQDDDAEDIGRAGGPEREPRKGHQAQQQDPARPHNARSSRS